MGEVKLNAIERREWNRLVNGADADLGILCDAGLVSATTKIVLRGATMTKEEVVELTTAGRAALSKAESSHGA